MCFTDAFSTMRSLSDHRPGMCACKMHILYISMHLTANPLLHKLQMPVKKEYGRLTKAIADVLW